MPNPQMISFGPGQGNSADLQAQQIQLQRQQQLADMLRQQALAPTETQVVSGRVVKNSPWLGVAQLAKALMANRLQSQNDTKQTELGNAAAERSAAALRALAPPGVFDAPPQANTGMMGMPAEDAPPPQQGPQLSPELKQAWVRALKVSQTNPELGNKMILNLTDLTGNQKDWMAQGIDPRALGAAELKKAQAGGLVNVAPNNTVLDAGTNKPAFVAPDFQRGMNNSYGQNGQPQISTMQGAEAIPAMAGQVTAAEEAAKAAQDLVTVNTQDGPRLMPRSQAVQYAGGGAQQPPYRPMPPQGMQPNQGFPAGTQLPAPTPGMQPRADILQQERAAIMARPDSPQKMADLAAIDREIGGRQGAMPGIPLQTPAQAEQQVGAVKVQNSVDEALAKQLPQERKDKQAAIVKGEAAINLIDKALAHPGLAAATGLRGTIDPRNYIPGTDAKNFNVLMDQLRGQTFLQAMESLRGTGQITEIEGKKASDAIARLSTAQDSGEFKKAMTDFKSAISGGLQRTRATKDSIDVARQKLDEMPVSAIRKYNPATGRIE